MAELLRVQVFRPAHAAGSLLVMLAALVLWGWARQSTALTSVLPGLPAMMPNTAVGMLLLGMGLLAWHLEGAVSDYVARLAAGLAAPMGAFAQGVTDAQIASIVVTANQVDIDAGRVAESRARNAEVKRFGQQMVAAHTGVNKQAAELVTQLGVTPQDNPTAQSLKTGGAENVKNLNTLSGAAFDKAYIDHEVVYHQQVLDAMDKTLIPSASNAELKALLVKVRPAFVAHLEHAKQVQAKLGK